MNHPARDYVQLVTYIAGEIDLSDSFFKDVTKQALTGVKNPGALLVVLQSVWDSGRFAGIDEAKEAMNG
jgi:hypothetical protein